MEQRLADDFIPSLIGSDLTLAADDARKLLGLSVKAGSKGLPDPRETCDRNYNTSTLITEALVATLRSDYYFFLSSAYETRKAARTTRVAAQKAERKPLLKKITCKLRTGHGDRGRVSGKLQVWKATGVHPVAI